MRNLSGINLISCTFLFLTECFTFCPEELRTLVFCQYLKRSWYIFPTEVDTCLSWRNWYCQQWQSNYFGKPIDLRKMIAHSRDPKTQHFRLLLFSPSKLLYIFFNSKYLSSICPQSTWNFQKNFFFFISSLYIKIPNEQLSSKRKPNKYIIYSIIFIVKTHKTNIIKKLHKNQVDCGP